MPGAVTALAAAAVSFSAGEGRGSRFFNVRPTSCGDGGGGVRTFRPVSTRALTVCHVAVAGLGGLMRLREALPNATGETATGVAPPPPVRPTLPWVRKRRRTTWLGLLGEST